jgi:polo-like kinase 1
MDHELLIQKSESQPRTELVVKFVDFSSKYGLGYMLSNGSYGVLFNDSTKIILHRNLFHFNYIERSKQQPTVNGNGQAAESVTDQVSQFDFFNFPESINKKVVLLQHFKSYLDGNQKFKPLEFTFTKENAPARNAEMDEQLVYIKKWKRAKKAILLRNTNKVIQVMFQDQSELILCSGSGFVTFVNSKQEVKTMPLSKQNDANLEATDKSLFKRLQYAKEILV